MGTVIPRRRSDGTTGFTAQIRLKRKGRVIYTQAQTFDRQGAATAWLKKREGELAQPGALEQAHQEDPTLAEVIDRYIAESVKKIGKTKAQVLKSIKKYGMPICDARKLAVTRYQPSRTN